MSWSVESLTQFVEVIIAGGVGVILRDVVQYFLKKRTDATPDMKRVTEQGIIEKALLNISHSNDELTEDITRIRTANVELEHRGRAREEWWQARWDAREERWNLKEAELQAEIEAMRRRMVELIGELDEMRARLRSDFKG